MTVHYKIQIITANIELKLSYRNGKFFKLEKIRGKLTDIQVKSIGVLIPPTTEQIASFQRKLSDKMTITPIEKEKSLFSEFSDAWFVFYQDFMGIKPRFNAADGYHLKQIIKYLTNLSQSGDQALALWKIILNRWKILEDFHKNNTDLKYINSRINVIINNVKRINQNTSSVSSDYLEGIKRDLQSD